MGLLFICTSYSYCVPALSDLYNFSHFQTLKVFLCSSIMWFWSPLLSSGQNSRHYQIFWEVVGLERGSLSLVSTIEELLERKSSGCSLENRDYSRMRYTTLTTRHPSFLQKLALTSPTSGCLSVGIVHSFADSGHGVFFLSIMLF
jgi:hypothetical protein